MKKPEAGDFYLPYESSDYSKARSRYILYLESEVRKLRRERDELEKRLQIGVEMLSNMESTPD